MAEFDQTGPELGTLSERCLLVCAHCLYVLATHGCCPCAHANAWLVATITSADDVCAFGASLQSPISEEILECWENGKNSAVSSQDSRYSTEAGPPSKAQRGCTKARTDPHGGARLRQGSAKAPLGLRYGCARAPPMLRQGRAPLGLRSGSAKAPPRLRHNSAMAPP